MPKSQAPGIGAADKFRARETLTLGFMQLQPEIEHSEGRCQAGRCVVIRVEEERHRVNLAKPCARAARPSVVEITADVEFLGDHVSDSTGAANVDVQRKHPLVSLPCPFPFYICASIVLYFPLLRK